jgi:hypothetical protein
MHIEPGHDRLASSRIVGKEKPDPWLAKEAVVDGLNLMRERLNVGDSQSCHIVLERHLDPPGLDAQAEQGGVGVKQEPLPGLDEADASELVLGKGDLAKATR